MKRVYLEPVWKAHLAYNELIHYPPAGYQFVVDEGLVSKTARTVARSQLAPWLISQVYKRAPAHIILSHLYRFLKKPPADAVLTFAIGHVVFRKEPWVIEVSSVMDPVGPYPNVFWRYGHIIEKAFSSPWCKKILCWSEFGKETIVKSLNCSSFADKIEVLPRAVHKRSFSKVYNEDKVRLFFLGSANMAGEFEARGGREVVEAFRILSQRYDNLELTIRSDVPHDLRNHLAGLRGVKLIDQIVPAEQLQQLFLEADILLFPGYYSAWLLFLEAMSYELPVIATAVHDSPEYIDEGQTGMLLLASERVPRQVKGLPVAGFIDELRNAMGTPDPEVVKELVQKTSILIENPELRRQMGRAGRREVEHGKFSIERRNEKLKRIFDEAIGSSSRA